MLDELPRHSRAAPEVAAPERAASLERDPINIIFASSEPPADLLRHCPNCGQTLVDRSCKLVCSCGYFLSCSDYY